MIAMTGQCPECSMTKTLINGVCMDCRQKKSDDALQQYAYEIEGKILEKIARRDFSGIELQIIQAISKVMASELITIRNKQMTQQLG